MSAIHQTWVDEVSDREGDGWQAVCGTTGCLWAGTIFHADQFDNEADPSDAAHDMAHADGSHHEMSN